MQGFEKKYNKGFLCGAVVSTVASQQKVLGLVDQVPFYV